MPTREEILAKPGMRKHYDELKAAERVLLAKPKRGASSFPALLVFFEDMIHFTREIGLDPDIYIEDVVIGWKRHIGHGENKLRAALQQLARL